MPVPRHAVYERNRALYAPLSQEEATAIARERIDHPPGKFGRLGGGDQIRVLIRLRIEYAPAALGQQQSHPDRHHGNVVRAKIDRHIV